MSERFRAFDRDTLYLLPPSVQDWLPESHLARFVVEVVSKLDLGELERAYAGRGIEGLPSRDAAGDVVLRVCDRGVFEPEAGTGHVGFGGVPVYRSKHASGSRHDRDVSETVSETAETVIRSDSAVGADDGISESGQDQSGRKQGEGECVEAQRIELGARDGTGRATEGGSGASDGNGGGGRRGRAPRGWTFPRN